MSSNGFRAIVTEINSLAKDHSIGKLQKIRQELHRKHAPTSKIFTSLTTFDTWAFHHGGRKELQFNLGIEHLNNKEELRFGVAFSFRPSQSLPKIEVLFPKVNLFNDYMKLYPEEYADMRMWHYTMSERSSDYMPAPILPELVTKDVFVFLGKRQLLSKIDYGLLLNAFDRLLPLYQYVESNGSLPPVQDISMPQFKFRSGYTTAKASSAVISQTERELDANLRHNILQEVLCRRLSTEYGKENVGDEIPSGTGTRIDVVVRQNNEYWFYEIKTANSPRACIRQAMGQLLEYAFWNDSQKVTRLIIVGETPLDKEGVKYLNTLRKRFSLPIEYEYVAI